ncbi:MAG: DegV family protein [Clostridia bacterium]|nr:DegV family protein [Clostridia bacterium]
MKVLVSTDTSCLVSNEVFKNYDISVFPLNVIIDGEEFLDGVTINQEQLKVAMRSRKNIKTSTPPLGLISEYFEEQLKKGYDHIIHFTISSKLSSMNDLFKNVAEKEFNGKITVIDSLGLSLPMLSYVFYAYNQVNLGVSPEEIVKVIEESKLDNKVIFIPENLTALKNGGRISPNVAFIGNLLGIKPVITLKEGSLEKIDTTRRERRYLVEAVKQMTNDYPISDYDYCVISFDTAEYVVKSVYECMDELFGEDNYVKGLIPINVCAHCGPGTIGIIATRKMGGVSLIDYIK